MDPDKRVIVIVLLCALLIVREAMPGLAHNAPTANAASEADRSGIHDFDWDIGTWKTHQRRLLHPLTGSTTWVEYTGTDVVRKIWDGANTGVIEAGGLAGHLELFTLRLYSADSHQWSIYFTSSASDSLSKPVVGAFQEGRGEFYDQELLGGKAIFVRFRVYDITSSSCQFDQSFSADGGKTWETNFVVTETRVAP